MRNIEVEFKYSANEVSLASFKEFCVRHGMHYEGKLPTAIEPAGFDYFYKNSAKPGSFCRHRKGALTNQLTFKQKLADKNNFIRTEHNIDLDPQTTEEQIGAFLAEFGYTSKSCIYKNAFVYFYEGYNFVYYIVYDEDMGEYGRFIEIEMDEKYPWVSQDKAYSKLLDLEQMFKPLGITPQARIKRSLFEMFAE